MECQSCGTALQGRYCHVCGEKRLGEHDLSLGAFLHDAFHFHTHLDNKLVKTLKPLLTRPGQLTADWIRGRRTPFAKPIQLFVVLNLIFFLVASRLGIFKWNPKDFLEGLPPGVVEAKRLALGFTLEQFLDRMSLGVAPHKKWIFLVLIPVTALALWAFHPRRRLVEHLVFAIHHATVLFLVILGIWLVLLGVALPTGFRTFRETWLLAMLLGSVWWYAVLALRRVYGIGWLRASSESLVLAVLILPVILVVKKLAFTLAFRGL